MASAQPDEVPEPTPMEGLQATSPTHPETTPSEALQGSTTTPSPQETNPLEILPDMTAPTTTTTTTTPPPLSKNALKRQRKQQEWEDGADARRKLRKQKRQATRVRKREHRAALVAQGIDPDALARQQARPSPVNVPVSIVFDCAFEDCMLGKELVSLGSQITRSYSENRTAACRAQLYVSDWQRDGKLATRFRDVLGDKHKNWRGIEFLQGDFLECCDKAREHMRTSGGTITPVLQRSLDEKAPWVRDEFDPLPLPGPEPEHTEEEHRDVVYLSSDSPYTLDRLEPNTSYVIGGLVDKNREKGICYKRARERGIRTARLPIGQYMVMQSRQVLATNHVVEIMLKWLECGSWGEAFLSVIPKRKGGHLRKQEGEGEGEGDGEEGGEGEGEGEDEGEDEGEGDRERERESEDQEKEGVPDKTAKPTTEENS